MAINNNINLLFKLNISTKNSLEVFHNSTRDNDTLKVLKCKKSGVIVLEKLALSDNYYEENLSYTNERKGKTLSFNW